MSELNQQTLTPQKLIRKRKMPFDFALAFKEIRKAVQDFPKAAMFQLAEEGYNSVFEQLVACILSIRTFDEVSLPVAKKLFAVARTPKEVARLSVDELDRLISKSTFHYGKAQQILAIAERTEKEFSGVLPAEEEILLSFKGVGPKCANLVLGITSKQKKISVDIHVHRVTNRWGILASRTPEKTLASLIQILPKKHWVEINELLVPFGKHICTLKRPHCSACPVVGMCLQVGVENPR